MSALNKDLYWAIKAMAEELSFADFGSVPAGPVSQLCSNSYTKAMENGYFADMHYLNRNIEKRFNPTLLVEGAKSVLVFLVPYSLPDNFIPPAGISQYALGLDYHKVIKDKLFLIMEFLASQCKDFQGRAFTDSAPVMEREWAVKAGLGFIGKNNFLISKRCGIKNFIGVILCNAEIPSTMEMEPLKREETCGECGECQKCLSACPTGALCNAYTIDARKCLSYHTIENRELEKSLENGAIDNLHGKLFGCDNCSNACPWNSRNLPGWEEFRTNCTNLGEICWDSITEDNFKQTFKDSPLLRGGLKNIQTAFRWGNKRKGNG